MKKVIFLDIDGVLNTTTDFFELKKYGHPVNKKEGSQILQRGKLALLEALIAETGAKIVISSTWRMVYTNTEILAMFNAHGCTLTSDDFIGDTPIHSAGRSSNHYAHRGREIAEWLSLHNDVESFVILDDKCDSMYHEGFTPIGCDETLTLGADAVDVDNAWTGDYVETDEDTGLTPMQTKRASFVLGRTADAHERDREYKQLLSMLI